MVCWHQTLRYRTRTQIRQRYPIWISNKRSNLHSLRPYLTSIQGPQCTATLRWRNQKGAASCSLKQRVSKVCAARSKPVGMSWATKRPPNWLGSPQKSYLASPKRNELKVSPINTLTVVCICFQGFKHVLSSSMKKWRIRSKKLVMQWTKRNLLKTRRFKQTTILWWKNIWLRLSAFTNSCWV